MLPAPWRPQPGHPGSGLDDGRILEGSCLEVADVKRCCRKLDEQPEPFWSSPDRETVAMDAVTMIGVPSRMKPRMVLVNGCRGCSVVLPLVWRSETCRVRRPAPTDLAYPRRRCALEEELRSCHQAVSTRRHSLQSRRIDLAMSKAIVGFVDRVLVPSAQTVRELVAATCRMGAARRSASGLARDEKGSARMAGSWSAWRSW